MAAIEDKAAGREDIEATARKCCNLVIENCTVTRCELGSNDMGPCIGIAGGVEGGIVENNTITQGADGHPTAGIETATNRDPDSYSPKDIHIRYNDVRMTTAPAMAIQNGGPQEIYIYYNKFYASSPAYTAVWFLIHVAGYSGAIVHFYNNVIGSTGKCFINES